MHIYTTSHTHTYRIAVSLVRSFVVDFCQFYQIIDGGKRCEQTNLHAKYVDYPRRMTHLHMLSKMQMIIDVLRIHLICIAPTFLALGRSRISHLFNTVH